MELAPSAAAAAAAATDDVEAEYWDWLGFEPIPIFRIDKDCYYMKDLWL